jgi:D-amino-acid dehydrogenase
MGDQLRFAGTLELAGLDFSIDRRRVDAIRRAAARYLTGLEDLELREIWRGLRPCTPDGLPLLGRPARWANVILATGHAMVGVSLGPITGKLVAQLVAGSAPEVDLALLDPDRFA